VARRLLLSQTEPWADADFIHTWQTEMPGLHFPVHRDLLQGIAVAVEGSESGTTSTTKWCHVPADGLYTPTELFNVLFRVKEYWYLTELQPYLDRLCRADAASIGCSSTDQLLVRYASPVVVPLPSSSRGAGGGGQRRLLDGLTMYQRKGGGGK
jgi:Sister chromatid cohesion protein Dcc1